ncbi:DUF4232 domain-containing protein [Microbispora amethystogenes]|uniref:DUF4232 domain-containing protein n=1 Tax=Microbispora amethystogenes TaxID=1427754 RepID=UPI003410F52C
MRVITSTAGVAAAAAILLSTGYALSTGGAARPASGASAVGAVSAAPAPAASSAPAAHDTIRAASVSTTSTGFSAKAPARCRTTGLRARVGRQDAGAGNRYAPLVLTNTSGRTCWVYGFVGLVLIDGRGDVLRTRTRRESVTPHRVTLRPGASAHARLHWTVVPTDHETRCPASARLMIIPPDEVAHLEVPFSATVCDDGRIDARPMAPGAGL